MTHRRLQHIFIGVILLIFLGSVSSFLYRLWSTPLVKTPGFFLINRGDTSKMVAERLCAETQFPYPKAVELALWLKRDSRELKTGEYLILPTENLNQVLVHFIQGSIYYRRFQIIPGQNFKTICANLANTPTIIHTLNCASLHTIANYEGCLMPDTYFYARGAADTVIVNMARTEMQNFLQKAWANRAAHLPIHTPYQALVVASIIEKEAYLRVEYPLVASVIYRRLDRHMLLQMDSTVLYGLPFESHGVLTRKDLRTKTLYNTYVVKGLPPTPIAMPSSDAILAALHPVQTRALYFVAKGDGSHEFSETLAAQNQAVFHYQIAPDLQRKSHGTSKKTRKVH